MSVRDLFPAPKHERFTQDLGHGVPPRMWTGTNGYPVRECSVNPLYDIITSGHCGHPRLRTYSDARGGSGEDTLNADNENEFKGKIMNDLPCPIKLRARQVMPLGLSDVYNGIDALSQLYYLGIHWAKF